jgi:hypothetical protein
MFANILLNRLPVPFGTAGWVDCHKCNSIETELYNRVNSYPCNHQLDVSLNSILKFERSLTSRTLFYVISFCAVSNFVNNMKFLINQDYLLKWPIVKVCPKGSPHNHTFFIFYFHFQANKIFPFQNKFVQMCDGMRQKSNFPLHNLDGLSYCNR